MRGTIITGVWWRSSSSTATRDERGVVDDRLPPFGVRREVRDHAVERRGHGVEAAEHQEVTRAEQLGVGERPAFDLGVDEHAQQPSVVGRVASLGERALEVLR